MSAERFIQLESQGGSLARLDIHLPPVNVFTAADLDELGCFPPAAAGFLPARMGETRAAE